MKRFAWALSVAVCACAPASAPPSASAPLSASASASPSASASASASPSAPPCPGDDFGLPAGTDITTRIAQKRGTMATATKQIVVSSHHLATEAGLAILRAGGTAADAFVATVLVQDVVFPGVTSTAGITGVLVYEAKTKKVTYVHGGVADPIDPARRYHDGDTASGKLVVIPGAPAAYAEIVKRFGRKSLSALVEPAAKLATNGFPADKLYARSIKGHVATLQRSAYGKKAFFHDGQPVAEGETLKLEEFGASLRAYGKDPTFFHKGRWPREAVALANANGGTLDLKDFETYMPEIAPAMHASYMGHEIHAAAHGGVKVLVSLGAIELLRAGALAEPAFSSPTMLEMLLRVQRATDSLPLLYDRDLVARGEATNGELARASAQVAATVRAGQRAPASPSPGTRSSAVIVVDAQGNVVVGTHTIETLNWGEGLFVGGIPLSTSAPVGFDDAAKATTRMRIDPLSDTIVMKDGVPRAALAVYGTGLHPADVQILDAVIARNVNAEEAVLAPRVGYYSFDFQSMKVDASKNTVDPRFDASLLCVLKERGFLLTRSMPGAPAGFVDTGFPTLVVMSAGHLEGMPPDPSHIHGLAAGD